MATGHEQFLDPLFQIKCLSDCKLFWELPSKSNFRMTYAKTLLAVAASIITEQIELALVLSTQKDWLISIAV